MSPSNIIVALDFSTAEYALNFAEQISPELCALKIGKELFTSAGPELVRQLVAKGFKVFLDLKYHDIPNTVAKACVAAAKLGVWMINVHALGGTRMMQAARAAIDELPDNKPLLIAVTILTSSTNEELTELGISGSAEENVVKLATLAKQANCDGVVCSAKEASAIRQKIGNDFCLVTPGVRPEKYQVDDQRRIMTPHNALQAGSSYLVIGRPITQAANPIKALKDIITSC